MNNRLSSYTSRAPEFQKLPEGENTVRLASYKVTDSFHNYDGTLKSNLPGFVNPTEQLAITCVSTEGKGGITHRLNMDGYLRTEQLSDKELASGKFIDINGYACAKNAEGEVVRLIDEERSNTCMGILDQFFASTGLPVGSTLEDLDAIIADKTEFVIKVTKDVYADKDQFRISSFRRTTAKVHSGADIQ
jgi:hypothetical protein